jgi:hypothetical protein
MRAMPPPPYVPVTHLGRLSPSKEAPPPSFKTSSYSDSDGRKSLDGSWPQKPPPLPAGWADKQWFGSRRGRWLRFAGLVLLGLGLIAALVIGLTVGLRGNG